MSIVDLPKEVLCALHSFLCLRPTTIHNDTRRPYLVECSYYYAKEVSVNTQWSNLVNTAKSFQELKMELVYLSLNRRKSKQLLQDVVQKQLKNTSKQLAINLNFPINLFTNIGNLHFIKISNIQHIPVTDFRNISYLLFDRCTFLETNPIIHAEHVMFENTPEVSLRAIKFTKLKELHLRRSTVKGICCLNLCPDLITLCLVACAIEEQPPISTFNCHNLRRLYASMTQIVHFINYSNVRSIRLVSCDSLDLVSSLQSCEWLCLNAYALSILAPLPKLLCLALTECSIVNAIEISAFPVLKDLSISNCSKIAKIVINGSSLKRMELCDKLSSLKTVDIQTPTVTKCYLTRLESNNEVLFLEKYKISVMITTEVKARICFVR
jgi:hypothetical protein